MAATKIVAVRKAVVTAVNDLAAFADVEVMFSYRDKGLRRFGYTRDATFEHQPAVMKAGRNFRTEEGGFEFVIWIEKPGGLPEDAAEEALDLGLAVEEWVADHRSTVAGTDWLLIQGGGSLKEADSDTSAFAELVYPFRYRARLT